MTRAIPIEVKKLIIEKYEKDEPIGYIASTLNLNKKSVFSIVSRYNRDQKLESERGHRPKSLTTEHQDKLREWCDEDCTRTLKW